MLLENSAGDLEELLYPLVAACLEIQKKMLSYMTQF